ncbi:MAG: hypothetical protein ABJ013_05220 [Halioglobus sp.]
MDIVFSTIRWSAFFVLLLVVAGAGLEGEWLTWITGVILGLFLTLHPTKVKEKLGVRYGIALLGAVTLFFAGSLIDMTVLV